MLASNEQVTVWELVVKDAACPLMFDSFRSWLKSRRQFDGRMEEPECDRHRRAHLGQVKIRLSKRGGPQAPSLDSVQHCR
jgi:threonyl-tRNA synthetase